MNSKQTKKRYGILALIFVTVVINYMDRTNISVAAGALSDELNLTTVQMGVVFSAFAWTYSNLQIPGGILVDLVKPRILYPIIVIAWSLATLTQGIVSSLAALIACRVAIGIFEAPSYPMNNRIVTNWFPEKERASAIGIYTSGQFIGLAFLTPVLFAIQHSFGWRGLFIISGGIGIIWALIWYWSYRDPENHSSISQAELDYIKEGGGLINNEQEVTKAKEKFNWLDLKEAFVHRKLWGVYLGQFCLGTLTVFFLTWFPTYLVEYREMDFMKSGFYASVPYIGAFCGVLLSGFVSDWLVRKGYSNEFGRKAPVLFGMLLSVIIIAANYTDNNNWVIAFLALAFLGNGFASIAWVFVSLLAPVRLIGLVGGVFNFIGSLAFVVTPIVIGYLVKDNDFAPALYYIGTMAFLGFCSYVFLVGKVERIEI